MPEWTVILLGILAGFVLFWVLFFVWYRHRLRSVSSSIVTELSTAGDNVLRGPEAAVYRGGTAGYSRVKGNGAIVLTDRRVLFQKLVGGRVEVPLDVIVGARENTWFLRSATSGRQHLILQLRDGGEVGFIVSDHPAWMLAMHQAIRP